MARSLGVKRLRVGVVILVLYLAICVLVNLSMQKSTLEMASYKTAVASLSGRVYESMGDSEIKHLGELLQAVSVGGDLSLVGLEFNAKPLNYYLRLEPFDMSATQDLLRDGRLESVATKLDLLSTKVSRVYKRRLRLLRYLAYLALLGVFVLLGFVAWSSFRIGHRLHDEIELLSDVRNDEGSPLTFEEYLKSVVEEEVKFTGHRASVACKGFDIEHNDSSLLTMMEQLAEHLVRNSVEHGGRPAEQRLLAGKTDYLSIRVHLYEESSHWLLSVWDDGEGIDQEKILDTVVAQGLAGQSSVSEIRPENALKLIFLKGFTMRPSPTSTADVDLGLDDMRSLIKPHNGVFSVQNLPGKSCQFTIKFPKNPRANK